MNEHWQRCLEQFLSQIYHRSESIDSLNAYRSVLSRFFALYPKSPHTVTKADIEAFLTHPCVPSKRGGPPAAATRNLRLTVLKSFYVYASDYDIEADDGTLVPLMSGKLPTTGLHSGKPAKRYRAMSPEELTRFFAVIPSDTIQGSRDRALFLTYFFTARRRREILQLRWRDISESLILENGASRRAHLYHFRGKGHAQQEDIAELPEPAYAAIVTYLEVAGRLKAIQPDDPIFVSIRPARNGGYAKQGHGQLDRNVPTLLMKMYAKEAGLEYQRFSTHCWRHTSARERRKLGEDLLSIMHLLRHKHLNTTYEYVRMLAPDADQGAKLLASQFGNL